jgi:hypothetical protein
MKTLVATVALALVFAMAAEVSANPPDDIWRYCERFLATPYYGACLSQEQTSKDHVKSLWVGTSRQIYDACERSTYTWRDLMICIESAERYEGRAAR